MNTFIPLILIALGGTALVAGREGRTLLVALGVQWAGIAWAIFTFGVTGGYALASVVIEGMTALVCIAVLWLTTADVTKMVPEELAEMDPLQRARMKRAEERARRRVQAQMGAIELLWPLVIVLAGGMAGFALARLYPLGGSEASLLAFYWVTLAGALALMIDGAREPVKLGVGLIALLNGALLLVSTLGEGAMGNPITLGLMSAVRIALAVILAYSWAVIKAAYGDLDLTPLFTSPNESHNEKPAPNTETALVASEGPNPDE